MAITIKTGKEARAEILSGATQLNQVVSSSLGPAGRWTLFRHGEGTHGEGTVGHPEEPSK